MLSRLRIKFHMGKFMRERPKEIFRRRITSSALLKKISEDFTRCRLSKIVDICCRYISRSKTAAELCKRFEHTLHMAQYFHEHGDGENAKAAARRLASVLKRKRDIIMLEHINYWRDMGNFEQIHAVLKMPDKFSHGVREQAKNILAGWEIYIYCSVCFPQSNATYYYRTEITNICPGDKVLVPVGEENEPTEATVTAVREYTYENVPYPIDKTKSIYSRVE